MNLPPSPEQLIVAGSTEQAPVKTVDTPPERPSTTDVKVTPTTPTKVEESDDKMKQLTDFLKPGMDKEEGKEPEKKVEKVEVEKKEELEFPTARKPLAEQMKDEDFTGYSEEEVSYFKKMDKTAREWVKGQIKKQKEEIERLRTPSNNIPQNWLEHEEAYRLHPVFKESAAIVERAGLERQYWENQLIAVKNGEKWKDLVEQGGKLYQQERAADAQSEVYLFNLIDNCKRIEAEHAGKATAIRNTFQQQRSQLTSGIRSIEDKFFPQYTDAKAWQDNKYVKNAQTILQNFGQQSNPLGNFFLKLYLWGLDVYEKNQELESKLNGKQTLKEERLRAGPTAGELQGGKTTSVDPEDKPFDMADFEKIKNGV